MRSKRRSPILHPVKEHTRGGVTVSKHEKGKGKRAKKTQRTRTMPSRSSKGSGFNVSLFFTDKPRETVNVSGTTYTQGTRNGLTSMKTPAIPVRMQIRRRKR